MDLRDHAASTKPAVILHPSGVTVSFDELETRANRLAHYLHRQGLAAGDTIAVVMENNEHIHAVMWAARRSGLYYTLINTQLRAPEISHIVGDSGAKAIISSVAMRAVSQQLSESLPRRLPSVALIADGELEGWRRYPECVAAMPATSLAAECDGQL